MTASSSTQAYKTRSLVMSFQDIPVDGMQIEASTDFVEISSPVAADPKDDDLSHVFKSPIFVEGTVTPVGSKVDLRGSSKTLLTLECDRCTETTQIPVTASITTFLMAKQQFSPYDKPGGRVIHGSTRDVSPSRHHSKSKAEVLTDAEGEHEDESFGAFDGKTVDLRPIVREQLILQIPMKVLCSEACEGLCLKCGGVIHRAECTCADGPVRVLD